MYVHCRLIELEACFALHLYFSLFSLLGTGLQGQAVFKNKLTFRPHSTDSQTHRKMTLSIADRFSKAQVQFVITLYSILLLLSCTLTAQLHVDFIYRVYMYICTSLKYIIYMYILMLILTFSHVKHIHVAKGYSSGIVYVYMYMYVLVSLSYVLAL